MITKEDAITSLVPSCAFSMTAEGVVTWLIPSVAPVTEEQIQEEMVRLQAEAEADAQAVIDAKQSAISKLTALGLTQDEVKAILGASA